MSAANHMTAGRDSRLMVEAQFAKAYQQSGFEAPLMCGNLDAPARIATGSTFCLREIGAGRNKSAPALAFREGVAP